MLYTYECPECGQFDVVMKLSEMTQYRICPTCGGGAKKVIVPGHGGIQEDTCPSWLPSACQTLLEDGEPMLQTRGEYKRYLKERGVFELGGREV